MTECRFIQMTGPLPGAIGIVQLHGNVQRLLRELTGQAEWPIGRAKLVRFADVDEGLAVRLASDIAQLMPHGGPRVMQRLDDLLRAHGAIPAGGDERSPRELYPEADDAYEAIALAMIARAASPLAIDLLLAQPAIWRAMNKSPGEFLTDEDRARSQRLNRLIDPPLVVLAGPPNVGKSTLSNALVGRSMSIAVDMPGTTRDYTVARIELAGLVVNWHDTPGLRETNDPIEAKAIELAGRLMERADLLLEITDREHDWPTLPRDADVRIASKCDLSRRDDSDVAVSAMTGQGMADLVRIVRDRLVTPSDLDAATHRPWLFDDRLLRATREANDQHP
jgi:tRNA modification GTPase